MLATLDHAELDAGPRAGAPGAERFCVVTRAIKPVDELIRFVVGPDGEVVPDLKRKLPGRGIWVTATRAALTEAVKRNAFARGFRRAVKAAPDLVARTEALLERAALDALAIAGKAGLVACGAFRVEHALAEDRVVAIVHAGDAAADGVRKLDAAVRRNIGAEAEKIPVVREFTSTQLDLALARTNVVHAALLAGSASNTFLARCARLGRFRSADPDRRGAGAPERMISKGRHRPAETTTRKQPTANRKPEDRDLND